MVNVQQALENLRDSIAQVIADLEVWSTLQEVQDTLGLPKVDVSGGKHKYLRKVTAVASDDTIIRVAQQMLICYPGTRAQPSDADLQLFQDALWWIESRGIQQISNTCRYRIIESVEDTCFWGRLTLREFFAPAIPISVYGCDSMPEVGDDGCLYRAFADISVFFGEKSRQIKPSRISVAKYFREIGLTEWPDRRFCLLVERLVHPEVQLAQNQRVLVERLDELLQQEDFELRAEGSQAGLPVYKVRKRATAACGVPKYIIFAATEKPDIVIDDALDMNIRIVRHEDKCLVYDRPPPAGNLTWTKLVEWWCKQTNKPSNDEETRREFGERLQASLQSEAERVFFATYFRVFKPILGDDLPALLPQVYLHYDPRSLSERSKQVLVRQRMDFLMLLANATRIVIEIDGIQHYSEDKNSEGKRLASPSRYAEMVAEDRRIRNLGYEVYRFGGAEIVYRNAEKFVALDSAKATITSFFQELFTRHGINPVLERHSRP
ncbi:MAG: hypothetical protein HC786_13350 [Richelia sp. CSU_2_1]|nr:hypothetical protein [Microcoleus sp. SM1_3_4]NJR23069.1 hypothetical protein [Richelia sp. CSU_2_1]